MNHIQAEEWLHSLPHRTSVPGVESEKMLLHYLGDPQTKLKFVHIAGTNGKGSAAAMLSNILKQAGYKVGMTISPFILEFRERFQINGEMIPHQDLATITETVQQAALKMQQEQGELPCEFAAVTAVALVWFAQQNCDIVVLETGIGGRIDATNAVENTEVACIMRIGLDHTEMLGDTLEKIAAEKCGILKNGCTVVTYPLQPQPALDEIMLACQDAGCELVVPDKDDLVSHKTQGLHNRFCYGGYEVTLSLPGMHQQYNAMVCIEAAIALWRKGWNIDDDAILRGLYQTTFPARIEVMRSQPLVIIDGCHNPDGAEELVNTLKKAKLNDLAVVMGVMGDKDYTAILKHLSQQFDQIYTVTPATPRAMDAEQLAEQAMAFFPHVTICDTVQDAVELAQEDGYDGCVICGSLYLASEARGLFV